MLPEISPEQLKAADRLRDGNILCGEVGTGKTRTAMAYFHKHYYGKRDLYVITTAKVRDSGAWVDEAYLWGLSTDASLNPNGTRFVVDSWNNVKNYVDVTDAFFIFDEQRLIGSGAWVKSFYKINRSNKWILLSGTPGDTWMDYIPVFVANGFYKNKTDFTTQHVIYKPHRTWAQVDRYISVRKLERLRDSLLVPIEYRRQTVRHHEVHKVAYDRELYRYAQRESMNPYTDAPISSISEQAHVLRRVSQGHTERLRALLGLLDGKERAIVFYNYNFELDTLREALKDRRVLEWNGQRHDELPDTGSWVYLVQYTAGAEGWNCITTDTIIFWSPNYSYRVLAQCEGRIDRRNTPFRDLYYHTLVSDSPIERAILRANREKRIFSESAFLKR